MKLPHIGELFEGRYEIDRVLGEGGFARVYKARDRAVSRDVALKVLIPRADEYGPAGQRFLREARVIASLQDPHTITLYEFGRCESGLLFMAFEFVEGHDLARELGENGALGWEVAARMLEQLCGSLREAHRNGVFHRDIKPANILVHEYEGDAHRVKLLDFGLAKRVEVNATVETKAGVIVGTPRYMAPERITTQDAGPASDIYSLGLVVFEMLTGRPAIVGDTPEELIVGQIKGPRITVPEAVAPPRLRDIVEKMVERDPAARYRSIEQVQRDLRNLRKPTTPRAPLRADVAVAAPIPRGQAVRGQVLALAGVLLAAALLVGAGILSLAADEPTTRAPVTWRSPPTSRPAAAVPRVLAPASDCGRAGVRPGPLLIEEIVALDRVAHPVFVPAGYDGVARLPLLVLLHDRNNTTGRDLTLLEQVRATADEYGVIMLSPDGGTAKSWDEPGDVEIVVSAIATVKDQLCVDAERVFVLGHGFGGEAAERLACRDGIAGIATSHYAIAGKLDDPAQWPRELCRPEVPRPRIHLWGLEDPFNPFEGGRGCQGSYRRPVTQREALRRELQGCAGDRRKILEDGGTTCWSWDCGAPFAVCHVAGEHRWAGMPSRVIDVNSPFGDCSNAQIEFDVVRTVWRFFSGQLPQDER